MKGTLSHENVSPRQFMTKTERDGKERERERESSGDFYSYSRKRRQRWNYTHIQRERETYEGSDIVALATARMTQPNISFKVVGV